MRILNCPGVAKSGVHLVLGILTFVVHQSEAIEQPSKRPKAHSPEVQLIAITATPTASPTPTPTGTPGPPSCDGVYRLEMLSLMEAGLADPIVTSSGEHSVLDSWLDQQIAEIVASCAGGAMCWGRGSFDAAGDFADDAIFFNLMDRLYNMNPAAFANWNYYDTRGAYAHDTWYSDHPYLRGSAFYFRLDDSNELTLLTEFEEGEICDGVRVSSKWSPISLLWDDSVDVDDDVRFVSFPIHPGLPSNIFTWKASGRAPLLVYDPNHTGTVSSGQQLFGNWTFGGKRVAALSTTLPGSPISSAWRDGFEALGTLDIDQDAAISGNELEPLALWFDNDRDGVADQQEVRSLHSLGVTRLFYREAKAGKPGDDIYLTHGYERA